MTAEERLTYLRLLVAKQQEDPDLQWKPEGLREAAVKNALDKLHTLILAGDIHVKDRTGS